MAKRVLSICPTRWDREAFSSPALRARYEFAFFGAELQGWPGKLRFALDPHGFVRRALRAARRLRADAVIGTSDYPGCLVASMTARELGLPGPDPAALLRASHKFLARERMRAAAPQATPLYDRIDPLQRQPRAPLPFPFFAKPVKGMLSMRARAVADERELAELLRFSFAQRVFAHAALRPFELYLRRHTAEHVDARHFIAEELLHGQQATLDGWASDGEVHLLGITDSFLYPGTNSFEHFEHPSRLPTQAQQRMLELARILIPAFGLDRTLFNLECIHDPATDAVHVIELNPRMSYQFADLYEKVHGTSSYELQLALLTGEHPRLEHAAGPCRAAASFVLRLFEDRLPRQVPIAADINHVKARFPLARVHVYARPGERLSRQPQDTESFRYCIVNLGAATRERLHQDWAEVRRMLPFEFERAGMARSGQRTLIRSEAELSCRSTPERA